MTDCPEVLKRALYRERKARQAAESLLERKSGELYDASERLRVVNSELEQRVRRRTAELEKARDAALGAARAKGEFLANMSHEIRTPMNAIIGLTELVLLGNLETEQRDQLKTVVQSAEGLLDLINDILDFSKIEAGKLDLAETDFDLRELVESASVALSHQAHRKGLNLICDIATTIPELVRGDPGRLRQILLNLLSNAVKFTAEGQIVIKVKDDDGILAFEVSDTGIGIARENQEAVFDLFQQVDGSMTRQVGGTGLGLAICMRLVTMMNGRLELESELGSGSTFRFWLPLPRSNASARTHVLPALRSLNVLVVDDLETNRKVLDRMLQHLGCHAVLVGSAAEALAMLRQRVGRSDAFDLVIADAQMPNQDGFGMIEELRREPALDQLAILMLSSTEESAGRTRAAALGVDGYLPKPVRLAGLINALQSLGASPHPTPARAKLTERPLRALSLGGSILLAEDLETNQRVALGLLEKRGYRVTIANNGIEAVDACRRASFDLILMDIQMPEMGGVEATQQIRRLERTTGRRTPIVALTANAMKGDRERFIAAGLDEHLPKPVRPAALWSTVESLLTRSKQATTILPSTTSAQTPMPSNGDKTQSPQRFPVEERLEPFAGDVDIFRDVAKTFIRTWPGIKADISEAICERQSDELYRASHQLKGAVSHFGDPECSRLAEAMRTRATNGQWDELTEIAKHLQSSVSALCQSLEMALK